MTDPNVPAYCTLDGDVSTSVIPFRPSVANVGGAAHVNDDEYPPIPPQDATAEALNQQEDLIVRACRMMPAATFWVRVVSGTATLMGFKSCNDNFVAGDVTVAAGSGPLVVMWAAGKLPTGDVPPLVTMVNSSRVSNCAPVVYETVTGGNCVLLVQQADLSGNQVATYTVRIDVDGEGNLGP